MKLNFVLVARFVEGPLGVAGSEHSGAGGPVLAYERFAGAARGPLTGKWRRREPERTVLHATIRAHLRTFLEEARARTDEGLGLPRFVEAEFERYLACGILAHGFARVRCERCGDELLVAFSCKGRGFCPSCTTRRMHDTAARLVDGVLPRVPVRQWVLSLPRWARWLLARDPRLAGRTLEVALRAIFASLRRRARREGVRDARAGAVTFVQRFGGALNLNVHFHCVVPDGVFAREESTVRFVPLGAPPDEEVEAILRRVVVRLLRLLRPRAERMDLEPPDALANAQSEALLLLSAAPQEPPRRKQHSAFLEGFSLHAGVHLHANDREALERLCALWGPPAAVAGAAGRAARWSPRVPTQAPAPGRPPGVGATADGVLEPASDAGAAAPPPPGPLPQSFRTQRVLARSNRAPPAGSRSTLCWRAVRRARTAARAPRVEGSGPSAPPFPTALG